MATMTIDYWNLTSTFLAYHEVRRQRPSRWRVERLELPVVLSLEDIDTVIAEAKAMSYRTESSLYKLAITCRVLMNVECEI